MHHACAGSRYRLPSDALLLLSASVLRLMHDLAPQEPTLFQTTIYNNIRFGKPDATADEIYAAAKSANAHKFISLLPRGYAARLLAAVKSHSRNFAHA